jgi:nitrogenase molybdenum-iron protein NifN
MGRAAATIEFGSTQDTSKTAGCALRDRHAVPRHGLGLPMGIRQTDAFFDMLSACSGRPVPAKHAAERGRLVDAYIDAHKYLAHTRALIYGEEDLVVGLAAFLSELGIKPALCGSGGRSGRLGPAVKQFAPEAVVLSGVDFLELEDAAGELACDIMIGSSKGYPMARKLGKPLVRVGFPIHDRIGANRILHLGYRGSHDLLDRITNTRIAAIQDGDPNGYMNM